MKLFNQQYFIKHNIVSDQRIHYTTKMEGNELNFLDLFAFIYITQLSILESGT